ncbi:MAG: hypothetical protein ACOC2D_02840, partial [Spirochaetota bacterium]
TLEHGAMKPSERPLAEKLERELSRKEKALAEMAALVALKKLDLFYGGKGRGVLTPQAKRRAILEAIDDARQDGARASAGGNHTGQKLLIRKTWASTPSMTARRSPWTHGSGHGRGYSRRCTRSIRWGAPIPDREDVSRG